MDPIATIAIIEKVITLGAAAVKLGQDVTPFALALWNNVVNKKVVTADDLALLDAQLMALSNRLQAPLPPADDQDV